MRKVSGNVYTGRFDLVQTNQSQSRGEESGAVCGLFGFAPLLFSAFHPIKLQTKWNLTDWTFKGC